MPYRITLAYYMKKKTIEQKYKVRDIFDNKLAAIEKKEVQKMKTGINKHLSEKERKKIFKSAVSFIAVPCYTYIACKCS